MEAGEFGNRQSGPHPQPPQQGSSPSPFKQRQQRDFGNRPSPYTGEGRPHPPPLPPPPPMATATLLSPTPTGPYHSHHSSYSPSFPHPSTTASIAGMISPIESRRPSSGDGSTTLPPPPPHHPPPETGPPHRQSLPSLSDVLSGAKSSPLPPAPPQHQPPPPPSSLQGSQPTLPPPFATNAPPGPRQHYPETPASDKDASPRSLYHPQTATFPPRPDSLPSFPDPIRSASFSASSTRPGPPPSLGSYRGPGPQPSPTLCHEQEHGQHVQDRRLSESPLQQQQQQQPPTSASTSTGFPGHPPPQPLAHGPPALGPLPPGQLPLSAAGPYPISPRNPGHGFDAHMSGYGGHGEDYGGSGERSGGGSRYDAVISRGLTDFWQLQDYLVRAGAASRTVFSFAEHWSPIVREHQGNPHHPHHHSSFLSSRLPRPQEITDMIHNADLLKNSLEQVREIVQVNLAESERAAARMDAAAAAQAAAAQSASSPMGAMGGGMHPGGGPGGKKGKGVAVDDLAAENAATAAVVAAATKATYYNVLPVKQRRGRAAPPGRCYSCNRSDTPEWRRGPDGARTLCNACGLHFAKLERKKQQDARMLRPKPEA